MSNPIPPSDSTDSNLPPPPSSTSSSRRLFSGQEDHEEERRHVSAAVSFLQDPDALTPPPAKRTARKLFGNEENKVQMHQSAHTSPLLSFPQSMMASLTGGSSSGRDGGSSSSSLVASDRPIGPKFSPMKHKLSTHPDATMGKIKEALKQGVGGFKTPSAGSSGFTGIATCPAQAILTPDEYSTYPAGPDTPVGAVVKYVSKSDAENEVLCTQLGRAFGLHVPVIQPASPEAAALFVSPMRRQKNAFSPDAFAMLAMNLIRGTNLIDLCESGKILQFTQSQWNDLLYEFGKTAAFDLWIGNYDRFVRFTFNSDTGSYELKQTSANLGNPMLQFTPDRGIGIQTTHIIDSTSLAKEPKASEIDQAPDFGFDLLELADTPDRVGTPPPASPPLAPTSPSTPPQHTQIAEQLHRFFCVTIDNYLAHSTELPESIIASVESALKQSLAEFHDYNDTDPRIVALSSKLTNSLASLHRGIHMGLVRLASTEFQDSPELASVLSRDLELSRLLRMNLGWLNRRGEFREFPSPRSPSGRTI